MTASIKFLLLLLQVLGFEELSFSLSPWRGSQVLTPIFPYLRQKQTKLRELNTSDADKINNECFTAEKN